MPVYNESNTFLECFNKVVGKEIRGVDKEIIVVESNSTDGTRELVQHACMENGAKVILQDRAKGKGNAVRAGLQAASGDIVMIQDADLEYDVNDYDALVDPILNHRTAFVLGSRHTGSWKVRQFNDQILLASFFNVGHVFFRGLLNLLYGQSLKDPFTMFKVFRADCVYGLDLQCDRFDFDFELVIKLVRKGYVPLEIPVNYRARSFKEGKKVSALRDPWTWLRALIKYRFCKIELLAEAARGREVGRVGLR
jgi:glycosyltransferase involved in cell wall biosynthesis